MSPLVWAVIAVLGVLVALVLFFEVIRPLAQLRTAIRRLAQGDPRPVILRTRSSLFGDSSRHLREISEKLQQLNRQVVDEGFSLRAILASMVEGVIIVDRSQRIRLANEAFRRLTPSSVSPINRTIIESLRDHEVQQCVANLLKEGGSCRMEFCVESQEVGDTELHFEVFAGALQPEASRVPLGAVIVFHNVTAVRELEAVRKEFVSNVSHEFRTPLSIISGYIETLMDSGVDDSDLSRHALRVMYRNSQRLNLLIEDLLTISRLEQRTEQLDLQPMDYLKTLRKVVHRLEPLVQSSGAVVDIKADEGPFIAAGDTRRIEQVYTNLIENAINYGPVGQTVVEASVEAREKSIVIDICDNGPGIPPEEQKHIFERFYRVDKHRSRDAGGSGLGLSIVKHIIVTHGGSIRIRESGPQGTCFSIQVPIPQEAESEEDI